MDPRRSGNTVAQNRRRTRTDSGSRDLKSTVELRNEPIISTSSSFGRHFIVSRCKTWFSTSRDGNPAKQTVWII